MKLLPYDTMSIEVPAPAAEVVAVLNRHVEPARWRRLSRGSAQFQGSVYAWGFTISRIKHYRNSFQPVLYGRFEAQAKGTLVRIRLMPHPLVITFMLWWLGMLGMFALVGLIVLVNDGQPLLLLFCGGMGLAAAALLLGGFWAEVQPAKKLLQKALEIDNEQLATSGGSATAGKPL